MSEMQKELNQRIKELKESGKSGRDLSEELAKLAADQERIRKALKEMQEKLKNNGNPGGDEILEKMEETELDLVNKQITQQTLRRQEDILTRMLEAEKSEREQDQEEKREAKSASQYEKEVPKALEEYFKSREKEIELLRTVPPKLYPYFKKEVNNYFQRLGEGGKK